MQSLTLKTLPSHRCCRHGLLLALVLVLAVVRAWADQSVTLAWDPNPEPDVSAYWVYYGTNSRNYPFSTNVGNVTTATVYGLQEDHVYYFAITARNSSGLESDFSNEVTNAIPASVTNRVPAISPIADVIANQNSRTELIPFQVSDAETAARDLIITVTSTDRALVPNSGIVLGGAEANRTLQIEPTAAMVGTTLITVVVSDGSKASSTSFLLTVRALPTSLIPTFNPLNKVTILEDSGATVVRVTGITSGRPDDTRRLIVTAKSSNPALIPDPAVSYTSPVTTATLTFAPRTNAWGRTMILVEVADEVDPELRCLGAFQVSVMFVNDPPTLDPIPDLTVSSNAGPFDILLTGITGGPTNETQIVSLSVSSDNAAVIPTPALEESIVPGTYHLKFTPAANTLGSARITVGLVDDDATSYGGRDSLLQTFVVTVQTPHEYSPFENWTLDNFGQSVVSDPSREAAVWGDTADPDRDGRPNLVEFALGGDPNVPEPDWDGLDLSIVKQDGNAYMTVTVVRRKNDPMLRYLPEVRSDDSEPWSLWHPQDDSFLTPKDVTSELETVTYRDGTAVTPDRWRQFRLSIVSTHKGISRQWSTEVVGAGAIAVSGSVGARPQASPLPLPLVGPVRYAGTLTAINGDATQLLDPGTIGLPAEFFGGNGACYVEFEGELRMDIAGHDPARGILTLTGLLPDGIQAGNMFCVRRNRTLAEVFGTQNEAGLEAGLSPNLADNLFAQNLNAQENLWCYYRNDAGLKRWFTVAGIPADHLTISPGQGVTLIRRSSATTVLYFLGRVSGTRPYLAK